MNNRKRNEVDAHLRSYTAGSAVTAGTPVVVGDRYGIVHENIASGAVGAVYTRGQYALTKASGTAFSQGDRVYWDSGNSRIAAWTPDAGTPFMVIAEAAASAATEAVVDLEVQPSGTDVFAVSHTVDAAEAAANSGDGRADIDTGFGAAPSAVVVMVRNASDNVTNTGYVVSKLASADAGKVRVDGVAAGVQLDENDVIELIAFR